jgi:signal transduction histidine kinase
VKNYGVQNFPCYNHSAPFFAAFVAVKLTKVTKYNLSWMLISSALVLMAVRRVMDFLPLYTNFDRENLFWLYSWIGIVTSLFLAMGVFLIQKIFRYMRKVEQETRNYEKRLLNAVVQAEENERRRFANELHDGLGPLLSSIKMGLSVVAAEKKEEAVSRNLEEAVQEAIATVREISNNSQPSHPHPFRVGKRPCATSSAASPCPKG